MDLQGFKSYIDGVGLSSGNRYDVQVWSLSEEENALCCNVDLQAATLETFKWTGQQPPLKMPYEITFEPLPMAFYCADDGAPYQKLYEWQQLVFSDSFQWNDFDEYATGKDIIVMEKSKQGSVIGRYHYHNCFPMVLGPKTLSYDNRNLVNKFTVQFAYESMDFS